MNRIGTWSFLCAGALLLSAALRAPLAFVRDYAQTLSALPREVPVHRYTGALEHTPSYDAPAWSLSGARVFARRSTGVYGLRAGRQITGECVALTRLTPRRPPGLPQELLLLSARYAEP